LLQHQQAISQGIACILFKTSLFARHFSFHNNPTAMKLVESGIYSRSTYAKNMSTRNSHLLHKCINSQQIIPKCSFFRYFIVKMLLYSTNLIYFCTLKQEEKTINKNIADGQFFHYQQKYRPNFVVSEYKLYN
jgi:hypothetical protein